MFYGLACVSVDIEGWGSVLRVTLRRGRYQSHAPVAAGVVGFLCTMQSKEVIFLVLSCSFRITQT